MTLSSPESAPSQVTAEEQAKAIVEAWRLHVAIDEWSYEPEIAAGVKVPIYDLPERIAKALAASKREGAIEAHLEDARAGCEWCRSTPSLDDGYAIGAARRFGDGWAHELTWPSGKKSFSDCERPEVWDALSKLRSEGGEEKEPGGNPKA
jgi:hypothetical protein